MIKKHESMIQYHLARVPFYNGKDSPEMANANSLKEKIAKLGAQTRHRSPISSARRAPSARRRLTPSPLPSSLRRGDRAPALGAQPLSMALSGAELPHIIAVGP